MKLSAALALAAAATLLVPLNSVAQTFDHTTGNHFWNVADNWTPDAVPDAIGAVAILPGPTGALVVDLGEDIIVGELQIGEAVAPNTGSTTITGANSLTISGGTSKIINGATGTAGASATTISVPISIASTLTVEHANNALLSFTQAISGGTGLTINRTDPNTGARTVVLGTANTYGGNTTLDSIGSNDFLIVRLAHADAIPTTSRIIATDSIVLELAAANFARTIGTGAGQFTFTGRSGWGAIGADRTVTLNGGASVNWTDITNQLILGSSSSTHTTDFTNPLVLNGGTRIVRTFNGSGAIDARFSNVISGTGALHKQEGGTLSLAADNTYTGFTRLEGGALRLDHAGALGDGNFEIGSGGTLIIGADTAPGDPNADFARDLGTAAGQIQTVGLGGGNNQANAGFAAMNGNRTITLNSNAELTWGSQFFLGGAAGDHSRNLLLGDVTSDGTTTFTNPIDLGAGNINPGLDPTLMTITRNVVVRDGSAQIDAVLPGMLRGTSSLTKDNTGTLVLSANNTYSGGTVVIGGRLLVNNSPAVAGDSGTGTGPITLHGTSTLGGTGTVAGVVTSNPGTHISPGTPTTAIESLVIGGLTLSSGSILDFDLAAPGTSDRLNVTMTDGLTIDGGAVNLTDAGGLAVGSYTLIDYAGSLQGGSIATFLSQTPTGPAGFNYSLVDTGSTIDLSVAAIAGDDADFNNDGIVDAADYVLWRKFANTIGTGTQPTGDANGDTNVDGLDYDIWRQQFGDASGAGSDAGGQVPEPATAVLLSFAALFALHRRSRWTLA